MWYEVKVKEVMVTTALIEAKTMVEAMQIAEDSYHDGDIVCDELEEICINKPRRVKNEG